MRRISWPSSLNGAESSMFVGKLIAIPAIGLISLMVGATIRLIQNAGAFRYWLILAGSAFSVIALLGFNILVTEGDQQRRGFLQMMVSFGLFIPYLFGCYLFFYEGLWRLLSLKEIISARTVIVGFLFTLLGYMVVKATYRSTEFSKKIRDGDIRLVDK
jgi:hypothetical protein